MLPLEKYVKCILYYSKCLTSKECRHTPGAIWARDLCTERVWKLWAFPAFLGSSLDRGQNFIFHLLFLIFILANMHVFWLDVVAGESSFSSVSCCFEMLNCIGRRFGKALMRMLWHDAFDSKPTGLTDPPFMYKCNPSIAGHLDPFFL